MKVERTSSHPQVDTTKGNQTTCIEVLLSQICGKSETLRPAMFNTLLILASESDWALSTILEVEYINPLEEYCSKTQPCDVPESSSQHLTILARLCFSPHLEVSKLALKALLKQSKSVSETRSFLRTLKMPSCSTESSPELVPFVGRLCSTLAEHVSEMKSLFAESSPSDGTISALSDPLPEESLSLSGNTVLEVVHNGFFLLDSLLNDAGYSFSTILTKCDFVPLLKSTIVTCLDLLDHERNELICQPPDQTDKLIFILDRSWDLAADGLTSSHQSLHPIIEYAFSDVPQLCSLLERTSCHSSPTHFSHLRMIINFTHNLHHLIPLMLEENQVEPVLTTSKSMTILKTNGDFHLRFIWTISNLIWDPRFSIQNKEERKGIRMLQFERVLKPAKQYLQFILQREEFIQKAKSWNYVLSTIIGYLLKNTLTLERDLFEDGEIVETGREEWEVGWLVEKTKEKELGERLNMIRKDDEKMKKNEKSRWKKRVERRREAGNEDAMEGWLTRMDYRTRFEIVGYLRLVNQENGMNWRF
ncbi:hypothetical protein BLNAU_17370 [Blattamonas nauphoetae]|uniref:Uncharacterized protein n=1 Tax=Blattamonas nauphoetae TaxID=2049346 RepID=A0ABQ9X940_9EUKA|nr:hypothetical protein BLNAU_17370 [Blattamonas nauphoetae]